MNAQIIIEIIKLIEETKAKKRAILNLFLKSILNAKVKNATMNVINKIIKANIFNSPWNNGLQ